jgi:Domain of unknown function (DUF4386)
MDSAKCTGRIVGLLVFMHLAVGLMLPFILLDRVKRAAGLVQGAAASPGQVRAAVLLLFVGGAIAIAITIAAFPVIRRYSQAMTLWLLALAIAGFSLQAVDNGAILAALSLSQEYAKADASKMELFQGLAVMANAARKWAHYCALLVAVSWISLFCAALYRFRLVPRMLAGLGIVASLLQMAGVTLRGFLGYPPETRLAVPLAPVYVALALWLMVRGFDERHQPVEEPAAELVGA